MGRPKVVAKLRRTKKICFMVRPDELEVLKREAIIAELPTLSEYVRTIIQAHIRKIKEQRAGM